jgi:hypothetical protein
MACQRGPVVIGPGRPNRYAPISAVRSSGDRRRSIVVSAIEEQDVGEARIWLGVIGAHLGQLGINLAVAFGCGALKEVRDVVGEANVEAVCS